MARFSGHCYSSAHSVAKTIVTRFWPLWIFVVNQSQASLSPSIRAFSASGNAGSQRMRNVEGAGARFSTGCPPQWRRDGVGVMDGVVLQASWMGIPWSSTIQRYRWWCLSSPKRIENRESFFAVNHFWILKNGISNRESFWILKLSSQNYPSPPEGLIIDRETSGFGCTLDGIIPSYVKRSGAPTQWAVMNQTALGF